MGEQIARARAQLAGHVRLTPLYRSDALGGLCGVELWLKHEYQQVTGSFKERGACFRMLALTPRERSRGVVAASAGNHALALAHHGARLGIGVRVFMPRFAPMVKVGRCRRLGADVVLVGDRFEDARQEAAEYARVHGSTLVHGFDDPWVIAGQGTIALELLEQQPDLEAIVVPVGGGGLLAGIASAVASVGSPVRVIGVEAERAPTGSAALRAGHPVGVEVQPGLADGLAVTRLGEHAYAALAGRVDRIETVTEGELALSIVRLMEHEKAVVEGAGAAALAWVLRRPDVLAGRRVAVILSGGNIDLNIVSRVIERGLASAGRLCKLHVEIRDRPGAMAELLAKVAVTEANLLQVEHDRNFAPDDVAKVRVSLVLETRDAEHAGEVARTLRELGPLEAG